MVGLLGTICCLPAAGSWHYKERVADAAGPLSRRKLMMDAAGPFEALWRWIQDHLPAPVAALPAGVQIAIALGVLLVGGLLLLVLLGLILRALLRRKPAPKAPNLQENLGEYPPLKSAGGDRRLNVEGVPVRLRLLVVAPAGNQSEIDEEHLDAMLDRILPGLGA